MVWLGGARSRTLGSYSARTASLDSRPQTTLTVTLPTELWTLLWEIADDEIRDAFREADDSRDRAADGIKFGFA